MHCLRSLARLLTNIYVCMQCDARETKHTRTRTLDPALMLACTAYASERMHLIHRPNNHRVPCDCGTLLTTTLTQPHTHTPNNHRVCVGVYVCVRCTLEMSGVCIFLYNSHYITMLNAPYGGDISEKWKRKNKPSWSYFKCLLVQIEMTNMRSIPHKYIIR